MDKPSTTFIPTLSIPPPSPPGDVSRRTIVILLILVVLLSVLSTWSVMSEIQKIKTPQKSPSNVAQGHVQFTILSQDTGKPVSTATGRVALTINK